MVDTVIVALPGVDDRVNRVSSEEVAHLTLLYLGNASLSAEAVLYIQHACSELSPFGLTVEYRGTLGEDDADVLFFDDNAWDLKRVKEFRHYLLLNDEIKRAYDSADQFPEWTPHLTLGYPETPAESGDEDDRVTYVNFDRIAIWLEEFDGPEFRLKYDDYAMEAAMSDISTAQRGRSAVGEIFHYGVKGMQWGVINDEDGASSASGTRPVALTQAENRADPDGPNRRALVKKAALIAGGVAVAGGVAYGVHRYSQGTGAKPSTKLAEAPKKEFQQPTSLIHLARAKNKGLTFQSTGDTPDYFSVFDKLGLNGDVPPGHFQKDVSTGNIAARLIDPLGRKDFAGRPIGHDFVIPKNMADGIDSIEDVQSKIWPKVSNQYQKFWDENLEPKFNHAEEEGVAMSDISTAERGQRAMAELFHYGVKGMKWGVRTKDRAGQTSKQDVTVVQKKQGQFAKSKGGKDLPITEDAEKALVVRQKAKSSTTDALTNKELQLAVTRMNLEQQYNNLAFQSDRRSKGRKFIQGLIGQKRYGKKRPYSDSTEDLGELVRKTIEASTEARDTVTAK